MKLRKSKPYQGLAIGSLAFLILTSCQAGQNDRVRKRTHERKHEQKQVVESVTVEPTNQAVQDVIAPSDYVKRLGKGLDVDWAKTPKGMQTYSLKMVQDFKQAGLQHVRIRVTQDVSEDLLDTIEKQIDDCLKVGLIPVVAYQADAFKNKPNSDELKKAANWWGQVAVRLKDKSPLLSFDLIIEVTDALNKDQAALNQYFEEATVQIRKTNPQRIVFVSPRVRSDPENLREIRLPSQHQGQIMAEWHFYAAGPSKKNSQKLWTSGTNQEKQIIRNKIQAAIDWQKKTGVPTWVGAWMAGNYNDGNDYTVSEQVAFANFVACELDQAGVPFAVNSDTKFYDAAKQRWLGEMQPVLQAFLKPNCTK